jgi:hypothetical protein
MARLTTLALATMAPCLAVGLLASLYRQREIKSQGHHLELQRLRKGGSSSPTTQGRRRNRSINLST